MIYAKKSLGQNFLNDKNIVKKIISLTTVHNKNIIEIGPGLGVLTDEILKLNPKKLILIEKDNKLYEYLIEKYKNTKIIIINDDAMHYDYRKKYKYKIISNLPYNISSKFIFKILKTSKSNVTEIICMIQSELANKFDYSKEKINKYKFLSKYCSDYKIQFKVSPSVFYPKPKVNSNVVKFIIKKNDINLEKLDYFLKYFFINKRKKIKSNKYFNKIINPNFLNYRYEDLKYEQLLEIYKTFKLSIS